MYAHPFLGWMQRERRRRVASFFAGAVLGAASVAVFAAAQLLTFN